jgi:RNA polymerase sigma-70 factor, ECF subfamily
MEQEHRPDARKEGSPELPSDGSLLRRFLGGNQDAALEIYQRYARRLHALAKAQCAADLAARLDVDDIVQSVFASFFRAASRGYYDVPAGEELWKLFLVITLNKVRAKGAHHRAAKRDVRLTTGGDEAAALLAELSTEGGGTGSLLQLTIAEFLDGLPPLHGTIVRLRIEGYEVAEIAEQVARSRRTVERVLQEVRKKLAELLQVEKQ